MLSTDYPSSTEQDLDAEIASIRAEIQTLQKRKRFLSSSLLSSDHIQKRLKRRSSPPAPTPTTSLQADASISPLVESAGKHAQSNHYRIAFGITAFPFRDPSSSDADGDENYGNNLLGIRIDIATRNGKFAKPYYMLLKRERDNTHRYRTHLRVHRHTIPAFIPMEKLERLYLPRDEETKDIDVDDGESEPTIKPGKTKPSRTGKQDLYALVRELHKELVSWHWRVDAIDMLRDELGLSSDTSTLPEDGNLGPDSVHSSKALGIASLSATSLEARYVRLEWADGRVGRFKVSNSGMVERAVVIGLDSRRDKILENALAGRDGRVEGVLDRLRSV